MFPFIIFISATHLVLKAPCPAVKVVQNFNLTRFASGSWYDLARYPDEIDGHGVCSNTTFTPGNNGTINFVLSELSDNSPEVYKGSVDYAKNAGNSGILDFYSPDFAGVGGDLILSFLSINYDSYYITYKCKYDEKTKTRSEYAWVGSRMTFFSPAAKAEVDDFLKSVDQYDHPIDAKKLAWISYSKTSCTVQTP